MISFFICLSDRHGNYLELQHRFSRQLHFRGWLEISILCMKSLQSILRTRIFKFVLSRSIIALKLLLSNYSQCSKNCLQLQSTIICGDININYLVDSDRKRNAAALATKLILYMFTEKMITFVALNPTVWIVITN